MIVMLLSGVSGTGKTFFREKYLNQIPYVDLAEVHEENPFIPLGAPSVNAAYRQAAAIDKDVVVMEGYFLRCSQSTSEIVRLLKENDDKLILFHFNAEWSTIERRLIGHSDRLEMARRCYTRPNTNMETYGSYKSGIWWADQAGHHDIYCPCAFCLRWRWAMDVSNESPRELMSRILGYRIAQLESRGVSIELAFLDGLLSQTSWVDDGMADSLYRATGLPAIVWKVLGDCFVPIDGQSKLITRYE